MQKNKTLTENERPQVSLRPEVRPKSGGLGLGRKRGRPTPTDAKLVGLRNELVYILGTYWAHLGWQLKVSRTAGDIPRAFAPIRGMVGEDRLFFFLRSDSIQSNTMQIRKTGTVLAAALEEERLAQKAYEDQRESCQLADAGVFEASPEHRLTLKKDITYRIVSVRGLEEDAIAKEKALYEAAKVLSKVEETSQHGKAVDLTTAQVAHRGAKGLYERALFVLKDEREILRALQERLNAASPARLALAKKIASERQQHFLDLQTVLAQAGIKRERIEKTLRDQQAGFAQAELVRFIRSKRAKYTPINLANAIAGLPEISSRVSFRRCRKFPFAASPSLNYHVFTFVERCLKKRTSIKTTHLLKLFRLEIGSIPKTQRVEGGRRIENFFRRHLESNWWALKAAIADSLKSKRHPGELPYIVTEAFLRNLSKPVTNLDRLLLEDEKLDL